MNLETSLNCLGYHGFGGGYMHEDKPKHFYCNTCPLTQACWERHKKRTAELFPEATAVFDALVEEHGGNGVKAADAYHRKYGQSPPYMVVNFGNVEDGIRVRADLGVADRGPCTLPYPFPREKEDA